MEPIPGGIGNALPAIPRGGLRPTSMEPIPGGIGNLRIAQHSRNYLSHTSMEPIPGGMENSQNSRR